MIPKHRFAIIYLLFILCGSYLVFRPGGKTDASTSLVLFPAASNGWKMTGQTCYDNDIISVLKSTDYLSRRYTDAGNNNVSLYIGYHGGGAGEIHSPKHCLPGSGWYRVSSETVEVPVDGTSLHLVKAVYQKGEAKELFLYWFQVEGKSVANEYLLRAQVILNSIIHGKHDSAFIRVSLPAGQDEEVAYREGLRFINDFYPHILRHLPT